MTTNEAGQIEVKPNGTKPGKTAVNKTAPPVTFPLPAELWQAFLADCIFESYGLRLADVTARFQDGVMIVTGQPVGK